MPEILDKGAILRPWGILFFGKIGIVQGSWSGFDWNFNNLQ